MTPEPYQGGLVRDRLARLAPIVVSPLVTVLALSCASSSPRREAWPAHQRPPGPAGATGHAAGAAAGAAGRPGRRLLIRLATYRLPEAVSGEVASPDGRHLVIAGGLTAGQSSSSTVVRIDLRTGASSEAGRLPLPVHDAAAAVLGGTLLVFGGGTGYSYAAVQRPSPTGGTIYGALPEPRSDLMAVTWGRTAYLVGGHGNAGDARTVLATRDGRHFRVVASLPVPVRYPAVAVADGDLWVFGGLSPHGPVADVQCVNLRTGQARRAGTLPRPLEAAAAFTLDGAIYLAGGTTIRLARAAGAEPSAVTTSVVYRFDPGRRAFQVAGRLPVPVAHAAVAVTGGVAYLVGGLDGSRTLRTVSTLRPGGIASLPGNP